MAVAKAASGRRHASSHIARPRRLFATGMVRWSVGDAGERMMSNQARRLLRADREHRVSNTELFFDLVFILAFTRLTRATLQNLSAAGTLRTLLLLAAVWWVWTVTAWSTDWFDPEAPYVRMLLIWVMFGSLLLAAAVPRAFGADAPVFAVTYVVIHLGRGAGLIYGLRGSPAQVRSGRVAIWFAATGVLWIGGALTPAAREGLWTVAVAIDATVGLIGYPVPGLGRSTQEQLRIDGEHLSERQVQLFIVAIGELILTSGLSFGSAGFDRVHTVSFVLAFVNALALTQLRFLPAEHRIGPAIDRSRSPGRMALGTSYLQLILLAGVLTTAAGNELIIGQQSGSIRQASAVALVGGTALFLISRILMPVVTCHVVPRAYLAGLIALIAVVPATASLPPYSATAGVDLILIAIITVDVVLKRRGARQVAGGRPGR